MAEAGDPLESAACWNGRHKLCTGIGETFMDMKPCPCPCRCHVMQSAEPPASVMQSTCDFCDKVGDIQSQDMGEGRTMRLCAVCRGHILDGRARESLNLPAVE